MPEVPRNMDYELKEEIRDLFHENGYEIKKEAIQWNEGSEDEGYLPSVNLQFEATWTPANIAWQSVEEDS